MQPIHMGQLIEKRLKDIGMSKAGFGRRINISRNDAIDLLKKPSLDEDELRKISKALRVNLFAALLDGVPAEIPPIDERRELEKVIRVQVEFEQPEELTAFQEWWREFKAGRSKQ